LIFRFDDHFQPGLIAAVTAIGKKLADEDKSAAKKYPKRPEICSLNNLKLLLSLLEPLQIATDRLQTEKCSVSTLIMSCLDAFESKLNLNCASLNMSYLLQPFAKVLCNYSSCTSLFAEISKKVPGPFSTLKRKLLLGMQQRLQKNFISGDPYVIAAFLDARVKDTMFKGILKINLIL
jgi:hypothetical protein